MEIALRVPLAAEWRVRAPFHVKRKTPAEIDGRFM
jgi:hypothetical protein